MSYYIPIPFVIVAALIKIVSKHFKLRLFEIIANIVIIIGAILFIYLYLDSIGINLLVILKNVFKI